MKVIFLFFVLMGVCLYGSDLSPESCDQKSEDTSMLKGSFLKDNQLVAQSCDRRTHSSDENAIQSPSDEKTLSDFKNFVNSSK